MTDFELIPECWLRLEDGAEGSLNRECRYGSASDQLARIRLEGSPIWNDHPDGFNIANLQWYSAYLKERERQRARNTSPLPRTVREVIPQSRLATYGNFEYNEEREIKYSMCVNVPSSVDAPYSNLCRGDETDEIWMSPIVDRLMQVYLNPRESVSGCCPSIQESEQERANFLHPKLYSVDNSQHFELEMKIMATKEIWARELLTYHECYPMVFNQAYPILKPFSGYIADNLMPFSRLNRFSSPYSSYPVHDVTPFSPYTSNMSSSGSSTSSCPSTSPLHPIYQQQTLKPMWTQPPAHMGSPAIEELSLETADLSKFLLFTLDLETSEDCMKQTIEMANSWLNQVYPAKQAQKLEFEKQLLSSYALSVSKTVGPRKSLFSSAEMMSEFPLPQQVLPPTPVFSRLGPSQVKSTPLTSIPVHRPVEALTELVSGSLATPRRSSLPLSFSAVTKGACTKSMMEPSPVDSGDISPSVEKPLACTTRKSRSKHRPPHPTDPTRPSGVYTTLSGYKYFSPPRPRGSSEDKDFKTK